MISPVKIIRWLILLLLTCGLALTISDHSHAQLSFPDGFGTKSVLNPPAGVSRYGSIEVAKVRSPIDGEELFVIASPTLYDRSSQESQPLNLAVENRAKEVEARLLRAIIRPMDLETLQVEVSRLNNVTIIDAKDQQLTRPLILVSVTEQDADYHGKPIEQLAQEWRTILDGELKQGLQRLSVEELSRSWRQAFQTSLILFVFTFVVIIIKYGISLSQKKLSQRKREITTNQTIQPSLSPEQSPTQATQAQARNLLLFRLQQTLTLDRRLDILNLIQWLLFWLLILGWYLALYQIFRQIPLLARYSSAIAGKPIELLLIWFFTGLGLRISSPIIDGVRKNWQDRELFDLEDEDGDAQRRTIRSATIAGAIKGMITVVIVAIGILWGLNILGIPTGSVLAIGGLLGLAISFGSQSLVKDLVNGCLILIEDQFAVGDVINLGEVSGLVENLNLRVTQIRSADGELITIPNSAISQVKNLTRTWSRVNFTIDVAYQTNPDRALDVLREVCQTFYNDPNWQSKMIAAPDILGIDNISHSGMTIAIWIQTLPAQQWAIGREFRLRVRKALEANEIEIGVPRLDNLFILD